MANAIWVWGLAASTNRRVLLRIEDHDRERSRREFDAAILEDLDWLGFEPDAGPVRQSETPGRYEAAMEGLRSVHLIYACDCSRATFAAWMGSNGWPWSGPGCPGACRERDIDATGSTLRVALGTGDEAWDDLLLGPQGGSPTPGGDLPIRDRHGNWTYGFAVVVDDLDQDIDLVVRGSDLAETTPGQIRLGRMFGRRQPPQFAHHALILKPNGAKLSKAEHDTGIRELRAAGVRAETVIGMAATATGLSSRRRAIPAREVATLFR